MAFVGRLGMATAAFVLNVMVSCPAMAWGDEGHEIVALIAQAHLDPAVLKKVSALPGADTDTLTAHDIASEATWADKLRNANDNDQLEPPVPWQPLPSADERPDPAPTTDRPSTAGLSARRSKVVEGQKL